jgi:hypothetical protein
MLVIFNYVGLALCVLALFGGWAVKFSAWALGLGESPNNLAFAAAWCIFAALLDLVWRSRGVLNSSHKTWLRFIAPSTGGQVFFIPIWIIATVALGYQLITMFR